MIWSYVPCSIGEDLSEALRPRPRADSSEQVHAIEDPPKGPVFDKIKATHGEQRRWQRQDKFNRVVCDSRRLLASSSCLLTGRCSLGLLQNDRHIHGVSLS